MPPNTRVPGSSYEHKHGYTRQLAVLDVRTRRKKRIHVEILIVCFDLEHVLAVSLMSLIQWSKKVFVSH